MILPIAHERNSVERWPWVTFSIIALCLLAHFATAQNAEYSEESDSRFGAALQYYLEYPYLEVDPRVIPKSVKDDIDDDLEEYEEFRNPSAGSSIRQAELDRLTAEWIESLGNDVIWSHGLIPADVSLRDALTSIFLHGSWGHLLGNLLFLYITAPFVEDVFGRGRFAIFFLLGGVVSGLAFAAHYPELFRPLVGASGALAAVMGAFLVLHGRARIRFLYWFFVFVGTFDAPAFVMLPLWAIGELAWALVFDMASPSGLGGGVAYWVHVWGFVFGIAVTLGLRTFGVRAKSLAPDSPSEQILPVVAQAVAAERKGRLDEAERILRDAIRSGDGSLDVLATYWDLAIVRGQARRSASIGLRRVREEIRLGELESAIRHWDEFREILSDQPTDVPTLLHLAEALLRAERLDEGKTRLLEACNSIDSSAPPRSFARLLELTGEYCDKSIYREIVAKALAANSLPAELRDDLQLGTLSAPTTEFLLGSEEEAPSSDPPNTLRLKEITTRWDQRSELNRFPEKKRTE